MRSAGASLVRDFCDFGYPSTAEIEEKDMLALFGDMLDVLMRQYTVASLLNHDQADGKVGEEHKPFLPDAVVIEIADGILNPENMMLLQNADINTICTHFIYSAGDALSLLGGLEILRSDYGIIPSGFSGPVANGPLCVQEFRNYVSKKVNEAKKEEKISYVNWYQRMIDLPYFNNMRLNLVHITTILLAEGARTRKQIRKEENYVQENEMLQDFVLPEGETD